MAAAAVIPRPPTMAGGVGLYLTDVGMWAFGPDGEWSDTGSPSSPLAFVDSTWLADADADNGVVAAATVLSEALSRAVRNVARDAMPVHLTVPTHWGAPRAGVVERAAREAVGDVTVWPSAIAVARAYAAERDVVSGTEEWLTVEYGAAVAVVSSVRFAAGTPQVLASDIHRRSESDSGTTPLVDVVAGLATGREIVTLLVSGAPATGDIDALVARFGRLAVRRVDPAQVARTLAPRPAAPPRRPVVRGPGVAVARVPRRNRGVPIAIAAVLCAAIAVATGFALLRGGGSVTGARDAAQTLVLGAVRVDLPPGWRVRTTAGADGEQPARLELVATDGPDRRIIVTQTPLGAEADYESVVADLGRLIAAGGRDSKFGALAPDVEFGGRKTIEYRESPDVYSHVIWHVMVERDTQVSVGCQSLVGDWEVLAGECEELVRTMSIVA